MKLSLKRSFSLLRYWLIAAVVPTLLIRCSDDPISPAEQDIANFSQQLQGTWTLDKVTVNSAGGGVTISPVKDYACDKVTAAFQAKDVVNKYTITYVGKVVKVMKYYTCSLRPEELSWKIEVDDQPDGNNINWMTGKSFNIKEINEGTLTGELKLLFFNLDNPSPDGKPATSATKNKLWLDVVYDTKEQSKFRLEFSKN